MPQKSLFFFLLEIISLTNSILMYDWVIGYLFLVPSFFQSFYSRSWSRLFCQNSQEIFVAGDTICCLLSLSFTKLPLFSLTLLAIASGAGKGLLISKGYPTTDAYHTYDLCIQKKKVDTIQHWTKISPIILATVPLRAFCIHGNCTMEEDAAKTNYALTAKRT